MSYVAALTILTGMRGWFYLKDRMYVKKMAIDVARVAGYSGFHPTSPEET
jgi:hypothetical protein